MKLGRKIEKIYRGHVTIRSYERDKALRKGEGLIVTLSTDLGCDTMTISYEDLFKEPKQFFKSIFKSKCGGQDYYMLDYPWKPDSSKKIEPEEVVVKQLELF